MAVVFILSSNSF